MNAMLIAALEESLDSAPRTADVLAGIRTGIRRRRRRRTATTLAALGVVIALGVAAAQDLSRDAVPEHTIPLGNAQVMLTVGWLPAGMAQRGEGTGALGENLVYEGGGRTLSVSVQDIGTASPSAPPGWQPVVVNGRAGQAASRPNRAVVAFPTPSGRWATVDLFASPDSRPDGPGLLADAERVAASLREERGAMVRVPIALTYLPRGLRIIGATSQVDSDNRPGATIVTANGSLAPLPPYELTIDDGLVEVIHPTDLGSGLLVGVNLHRLGGDQRIGDIQGRPAYLADSGHTVTVPDFHGFPLQVSAMAEGHVAADPAAPQGASWISTDELIKVAKGVRWIG